MFKTSPQRGSQGSALSRKAQGASTATRLWGKNLCKAKSASIKGSYIYEVINNRILLITRPLSLKQILCRADVKGNLGVTEGWGLILNLENPVSPSKMQTLGRAKS